MRPALLTCLLALPIPATAQTLSADIGTEGLAATIIQMEALPSPTEADLFALGGLRFLHTVEITLQTRWAAGLTDPTGMVPMLSLPLEPNPAPPAFDPNAIAQLFSGVSIGMDAARAPLTTIPDTADFGVEINLADLWFDVNANSMRDAGENLLDIAGPILMGWEWANRDPATPAPMIRFDAADAAWLSAYTHLLGGIADVVLAYDPTASLTRMAQARADMVALSTGPTDYDQSFGSFVDPAYVMIDMLRQTPDAARATSARDHFRAMVADNRLFWARVAVEKDNAGEWLPNDQQTSALGLQLPPGTGATWLGVLDEMDKILTGDLLVPYWRVSGAGVNVSRMFTEPAPIDLAGWIQGASAVPYLEKGQLASGGSWTAFESMMQGQAMLLTLYLN